MVGAETKPIPAEIEGVTWVSEPEYDPNTPSGYTFTAVLPKGGAVAESCALPTITVTVEGAKIRGQPPGITGLISWLTQRTMFRT